MNTRAVVKHSFPVLAGLLVLLLGSLPAETALGQLTFDNIAVGDRFVELDWTRVPGDTLTPTQRENLAARAFGGYRIWRSQTGLPDDFQLLRSYSLLDTTWTFVGDTRTFVDPDSVIARGTEQTPDREPGDPVPGPFNGFAYFYSITWFEVELDTTVIPPVSTEFEMQTTEEGSLTEPVFPSAPSRTSVPLLSSVRVVPNPFRSDLTTGHFPDGDRVQFINLPTPVEVDIYTAAGDRVRSLSHEERDGSLDWDLKNQNGQDVVSGVYVFYARTETGETTTGRFVIVR